MGNSSSTDWLRSVGLTRPIDARTAEIIWANYDVNHTGLLEEKEVENFMRDWCAANRIAFKKERVEQFWSAFDKNKDRTLARSEIIDSKTGEAKTDVLHTIASSLSRGVPNIFFGEEAPEDTDGHKMDRETAIKHHLKDHEAFEALKFPPIAFDEVYPQLKTGDLILISGQYNISRFTKAVQGSPISHCAIIVCINGIPHLWESTQCTTVDSWTGVIRGGPAANELKDRLRKYYGYMVYRKLVWTPPADLEERIQKVREATEHTYYDKNAWEGLKAFLNIDGLPNNDAFFCSEFVAFAYQALGVVSLDRASNTFFPVDFSTHGGGLRIRHGSPEHNKAHLVAGAHFEAERTIVPPWNYPLKTLLLEEYLIKTGVSISEQQLIHGADCRLWCELTAIEGFVLDRFGRPLHESSPRVFLNVGIVPEERARVTEYCEAAIRVGQLVAMPCISKHPTLAVWLVIKEGHLCKGVLGALYIAVASLPTAEPVESTVYHTRTGILKAKLWTSSLMHKQTSVTSVHQSDPLATPRQRAQVLAAALHSSEEQAHRVLAEGLTRVDSKKNLLAGDAEEQKDFRKGADVD